MNKTTMRQAISNTVPFYENFKTVETAPYGEHCLQMCLKMMLGVLEPENEYSVKRLEAITGKGPGGSFATHYLMWMHQRGFDVKHITSFDWEAFRDEGAAHYEKLGEGQLSYNMQSDLDKERRVVTDFLTTIPVVRRKPLVGDIQRALTEGWLVRVSVDAGTLNPDRNEYIGHSVIALSIEDKEIVFHDPGLPGQAYRRESLEVFQKAMDSFGGMLDLIRKARYSAPLIGQGMLKYT